MRSQDFIVLMDFMFGASGAFYAPLIPDSLWLGIPATSSGDTISDESGNNNDGTIGGDYVRTSLTNHGFNDPQTMFRGNGDGSTGRYIQIPPSVEVNLNQNTMLFECILGVYTSQEYLCGFFTDGSNRLLFSHNGASIITLTSFYGGIVETVSLSSVPENERLLIQIINNTPSITVNIFYQGGVITNTQNSAGTAVGVATSNYFGARQSGLPTSSLLAGSFIGIAAVYDVVQTEQWAQNIYDSLSLLTVSNPLSILSPIGESIGTAEWLAQTADIGAVNVGVSDIEVTIEGTAAPTTDVTTFFIRCSPNVAVIPERLALEYQTDGSVDVYEYDPTATLLGSIASVDDGSLRVCVVGSSLAIYLNGAVTASLAATLKDETVFGTHLYVEVDGIHTFDLSAKDLYSKSLSDIVEASTFLDARALFYNGQLVEQLGYSAQNLTANAMTALNGEFVFALDNNKLTMPYDSEFSIEEYIFTIKNNPFSRGTGQVGGFFRQDGQHLSTFVNNTIALRNRFNPTDQMTTSTSGEHPLGFNQVTGLSLSSKQGRIYTNTVESVYSSDILGVGPYVTSLNDFTYGDNGVGTGEFYGRMSTIMFLSINATDSLMYLIQQYVRIYDYYIALDGIVSPTVAIQANSAGNYYDTVSNTVLTTTGALGTVIGQAGQYGVIGYADIASFLPATLSSILCVFDIELDTDGNDNYLLFLNDSVTGGYISFVAESTRIYIREYTGVTSYTTQFLYTQLGGLSDGDLIQVAMSMGDFGHRLWVNGILATTVSTQAIQEKSNFNIYALGANNNIGGNPFKKSIYSAYLGFNQTLDNLTALRASNLITANGAEWYKYLDDTYTMTKLNDNNGTNLLASGGDDDTLSSVTADAERFPNGEIGIDATSAGHINIGLTSLAINNKRYSIWVRPSSTTVSTTLCYLGRIYIDANNYLDFYFSTTANQFVVDYVGDSDTDQMTYDSASADINYFVEVDIPSSGGIAELFINGSSEDTVTLTSDVVGTVLSNTDTVIAAIDTSNTSFLQGDCGELQIGTIPSDGLSDYENAVGVAL